MGMLISADLPWDLTSHVHMQTSVTLVALIPVGEVTWIFVFFFQIQRDLNKTSLSACGSICKSPHVWASGSLWLPFLHIEMLIILAKYAEEAP